MGNIFVRNTPFNIFLNEKSYRKKATDELYPIFCQTGPNNNNYNNNEDNISHLGASPISTYQVSQNEALEHVKAAESFSLSPCRSDSSFYSIYSTSGGDLIQTALPPNICSPTQPAPTSKSIRKTKINFQNSGNLFNKLNNIVDKEIIASACPSQYPQIGPCFICAKPGIKYDSHLKTHLNPEDYRKFSLVQMASLNNYLLRSRKVLCFSNAD